MSLKIYILSPHVDDAAYGLTLTISKLLANKVTVTLINCFTVTKWTAVPVASKEIEAVSRLRAQEDKDFNALFGSAINIKNLDLLDAPLRNGYIFRFQPLVEDEWSLVDELRNKLQDFSDGILLCPLGIGDHIDHAICLEAVVKLYPKLQVIFFEDLPYAARISFAQIAEQVTQLEDRLGVKFEHFISNLETCTIDKEAAVRVYKSQMNEEICSEILAHMNNLQGERLWAEPQVMKMFKEATRC